MIEKSSTYKLLNKYDLAKLENLALISKKTRDRANINVYKDNSTGVIFLDKIMHDNEEYSSGEYLTKNYYVGENGKRERLHTDDILYKELEEFSDTKRRFNLNTQFIIGKNILDFGCGEGVFLKYSKDYAKRSYGLELQHDYRENLVKNGIDCFKTIKEIEEKGITIDTFFMFHVLEHLENPVEILESFKAIASTNAKVIIEVPHANDFLISSLKIREFIDFTLWSQHLILHTKNSIKRFMDASGLENIEVIGIQRHSIANHLQWANNKRGGGHKANISLIETTELKLAYENALAAIDKTDTLMAIGTIKNSG